ncbi:alpha/beta hydrolase [Sporosarcina pasteurii]|uniref:Predicted hydrolase of the alpha/beta-hydrolase fold n=1 Tax=Sporosarcina pasteurii TaxID=1474 RepID=A0A380BID0_SPOPA|nr:alpha/beta hydrolase [Sporosarcina pasteurii]MDS9470672.1 alpha/beta hydrolase [Sporosarcina pasteurii]QBQ05642.1 alpha/beta hydrolase [Sporosarcina pasteurii]SUJ01426.1 Predicted hydrolase of the alpha/beta-hydrolase fold [Sporosarcina pasteurii]
MKRRTLYMTSIFSSAIAAIVTIFGIFSTNRLMYLKLKDHDMIVQREVLAKRFDEKWYEAVNKEELWIQSPNDYLLHAIFLKPLETNRTVIICHGVTESKINSFKYARLFERLGFNSVIYDHRRHGESGGKTTSFGFYEKSDLKAIVQYIRNRIGEHALLGIHGESMGAATTILYAGTYEDEADFHVVDCPFSDFTEQALHVLRRETPFRTTMVLRIANLFLKMRDGYTLKLISPKEVIANVQKPMLFIHSLEDDFILPYMTEELYEKKIGSKMLKLFDKGAHAKSFNDNPEEYEKTVQEFLQKFVL